MRDIDEEQEGFKSERRHVNQVLTLKQIWWKKWKKQREYAHFLDLNDRVNGKALWKVLRMYAEGGKLLKSIRMHINILACVRAKGVRVEMGMRFSDAGRE